MSGSRLSGSFRLNIVPPSLPNYEVSEHRLTKKVKRWFTVQGCYVESQRSLFLDSQIIHEEVTVSTKVDLIEQLLEDGLIK
jgi:hypothetical protein